MKILLTVPIDTYRLLEIRCEPKSHVYALLKNGVLEVDKVVIRCESHRALNFLAWADERSPGAISRMDIALDEVVVRY